MAAFFKAGQDILSFARYVCISAVLFFSKNDTKSPLLLEYILAFLGDDSQPAWHGYLYAFAMFAAAQFQSILLHQVCRTGISFNHWEYLF